HGRPNSGGGPTQPSDDLVQGFDDGRSDAAGSLGQAVPEKHDGDVVAQPCAGHVLVNLDTCILLMPSSVAICLLLGAPDRRGDLRRLGRPEAVAAYAMSFLNSAFRALSSWAVKPRKIRPRASTASPGKMSSLFATEGSDLRNAARDPTTGEM